MSDLNLSYGIMQPYFLPYIGYYSLIEQTDKWIVFDDIQYARQSWGNRNRILKHSEGLAWIKVPIKKHKREALYSEIEIQNNIEWKQKMIRQFEYYRINAPNFKRVIELLEEIISPKFKYLTELNIYSLKKVCDFLNIPFDYIRYSELNIDKKNIKKPGDWALEICKKLEIKEYINPCMGHFMFEKKAWDNECIKLKFLVNKNLEYSQKRNTFEPRLSIIDVLMWNTKDQVHQLMDNYICKAQCLTKNHNEKVCEYDTLISNTNK